ncbi:uncharacterized protein LOC101856259 [Aplysia californica]|uniref:Uncharacterized protein LOC101856259 n=1 Tax=Aplysia californica TaxID=6500 RepID=A0ABM1VS96_APLCA|nr:uncharacterized protein LOC101856259 [Aplysia californica]XP_012937183.1 uncharacterized protein LOC101856259 [Aplysia californica]XP_035825288.1 uncharacterized protein LOC101856259 [Aplysia californica]
MDLSKVKQAALLSALESVTDAATEIIRNARNDVQSSSEDFVSQKIGKLFRIVGLYKKAFEKVEAKSKDEFERKASRHFRDGKMREAFDELLDVEREWDDFLMGVDKGLASTGGPALREGDVGPISDSLVNACTELPTTFEDFLMDQQFLVLVLLRHFA